jgi:hypothetical protein
MRPSVVLVVCLIAAAQGCMSENASDSSVPIRAQYALAFTDPKADSSMDLVSDSVDANGFPLNPRWRMQVNGAIPVSSQVCGGFQAAGLLQMKPTFGSPPCTRLADHLTWDTKWLICQLRIPLVDKSYHGHINWVPVTYTGKIEFEEASEQTLTGKFGDKDYNFGLTTPNRSGITDANPTQSQLHLEMDRSETFDLFKSGWWQTLAAALKNDAGKARAMIYGHASSALGLFGLDGVHKYVAELHPVYALAVLDQQERQATETWRVFIRHSAMNEGYCSSKQHPLDSLKSDTVKLDLPWHPNGSSVVLDSSETVPRGQGSFLHMQDTLGRLAAVFVLPRTTQHLVDARDRSMVYGTLYLHWTMEPGKPAVIVDATQQQRQRQAVPAAHVDVDVDVDEGEALLRGAVQRLTPTERAVVDAFVNEQTARVSALSANFVERPAPQPQVLRAGAAIVQSRAWPTKLVLAWPTNAPAMIVDTLGARVDSALVATLCKGNRLNDTERRICQPPPR